MIVDCDGCSMRDRACGDCVVQVLLGPPPAAGRIHLDAAERRALEVLAQGGLVPPLRLARADGDSVSPDERRQVS